MQLKIDKIPVPIFKFKLHWHDDIKKTVLPMIRENDGKTQTDKPADNISKLDFDDSHDMKRPWVLKILPMIILSNLISLLFFYSWEITCLIF